MTMNISTEEKKPSSTEELYICTKNLPEIAPIHQLSGKSISMGKRWKDEKDGIANVFSHNHKMESKRTNTKNNELKCEKWSIGLLHEFPLKREKWEHWSSESELSWIRKRRDEDHKWILIFTWKSSKIKYSKANAETGAGAGEKIRI